MRQDLLKVRKEMRPDRRVRRWSLAAALILVFFAGAWIYLRDHVMLSPNDTIVRAEFDNQTGDTALTDGLEQALEIALEQTPYLNILSRDKIRETLASLNLPEDTKLTADIGGRVCRRTGSRAVVAGSIADEGNSFHIELRAIDCATGRTLVRVVNDANSRDDIVHTLGLSAAQLRARLGEPKSSLAEFNKPLEIAASSSPDALHFLSLAYKSHLANDLHTALGYYRQAIEKDPDMALAYAGEGSASGWVGDYGVAIRDGQKAFELRDRLTAPAEFQVETEYYGAATGQWDKQLPIAERWVRTFPHDVIARINFGVGLHVIGRHDEALVQAREAARLLPSSQTFARLYAYAILAERLDEAREIYGQILQRRFDVPFVHFSHAQLAFQQGDQAAMHQELAWEAQHPEARSYMSHLQERFETYHGRLRDARILRSKINDATLKRRDIDNAASFDVDDGMMEAELGNSVQSRRLLAEAPKASGDLGARVSVSVALVSARNGDLAQAQKLVEDLDRQLPQDFLIQHYSLPSLRAAIKLSQNDPAAAVKLLEPVAPYDLAGIDGAFDNLYPAYLRGLAYLQLKDGRLAALEFQKILDHPAVIDGFITGALARLQLARAQAMMGDQSAARKSYENFLTLWKDADPDIPLYKEAKAEYARLGKPQAA
jgi:tetratricopeptide (TPR) repeat protein